MPIKDLPSNLRPREKAFLTGIETLSDIELLAIVLRSGTSDLDVLELSKKLLEKHKTLENLSSISISDLKHFKGIGPIKALELTTIFEIVRRIRMTQKREIKNDDDAVKFAFNIIGHDVTEKFLIVLVDSVGKIIYYETLYKGVEYEVNVEPKEVMALALKKGAKMFYCFHNHPSGDHRPSDADKLVTNRLRNYSSIFNINMIAHIVISSTGQYSVIS